MQSKATTVKEYLKELPADKKTAFEELRDTLNNNIPKGFEEQMCYGMIGYVVPHTLYPKGYHCDPKLPLPFVSIASQKNFIALYHMGIYANPTLLKWFVEEFPKYSKGKLDMGKSCIRFKNPNDIPFDLLGELCSRVSAGEWIACYEQAFRK